MKTNQEIPESPGVYLITDPDNQIGYVGSTGNLKSRIHYHESRLRRHIHDNSKLQQVYDDNQGKLEITLVPVDSKEQALNCEQSILDTYLSTGLLCNKSVDARVPAKGLVHTQEAKDKISEASLGRKHSPETIQKLKGREVSDETKQKLREGRLGKRHDEQTKQIMSEKHIGLKMPDDVREKIRLANANRYVINGTEFVGSRAVAAQLQIDTKTVLRRVKSDKFPDWKIKE